MEVARIPFLFCLSVSLLGMSGMLDACPLCLGFTRKDPTLADDVIAARDVVLAKVGRGDEGLEVESVIKGGAALSGLHITVLEAKEEGAYLLTRLDESSAWKTQGKSTVSFATFLPKLTGLSGKPSTDAEWVARMTAMRPFIAHLDSRIARSAWMMWAEAPYHVVKREAGQFDRAELHQWLADPAMANQSSLWLVLLGMIGNDEDTAWLSAQAEAAWKSGTDKQLAALLTAFTTRRGTEAVDFIERHYLRDRERTLEEIQAALSALGLHGREGTAAMRERVLATYRVFMAERKPLAGLVARDLAEWKQWEFAPTFQAMLAATDPIHPTARSAINDYLRALPTRPSASSTP